MFTFSTAYGKVNFLTLVFANVLKKAADTFCFNYYYVLNNNETRTVTESGRTVEPRV